jgi:hypothetical protein
MKRDYISLVAWWLALAGLNAQVNITTWQNSLAHTGVNAQETILTPANVAAPENFGLLFTHALDGMSFSQPLYMSGLKMADGSMHHVVYLTTEHDSVYAFDADNVTGKDADPLWHDSLLPVGTTPVPNVDTDSGDIVPYIGITATPVIDPITKTLYTVSTVKTTANSTYQQYLHALDLTSGAEKFGGPVLIKAEFNGTGNPHPTDPDDADDFDAPGKYHFNPLRYHQRGALALYNGILYIPYASHSDTLPYHGCILAYNATTLAPVKQFITTPNGVEAGIWQGGASVAFDGSGHLFFATGNGSWDQDKSAYTTDTDWGESFLKLPTSGTFDVAYSNPLNWFTPNIWHHLNESDLDLGSSGVLLLPDQAGPHPHLLIGGGKGGVLYAIDRDNLGGYNATADNSVQEVPVDESLFVTPAYFNGSIYYAPSGGTLHQQAVGYDPVTGNYISTTANTSTTIFTAKGAAPFISANGTANGIAWILAAGTPSYLQAYNAANISGNPIYSYEMDLPGADLDCTASKFALPSVANGKVYLTSYNSLHTSFLFVFGLLTSYTSAPAAATQLVTTASSSSEVTLHWFDNATNESGFKIERATNPSGPFTQIGLTGAHITGYSDSGLTPQTTYYYEVVATNNVGDSAPTNLSSATTFAPYVPTGLIAYWNFDEGTGLIANDVTGHGYNGTLIGEIGWIPGLIGNAALTFHGTGNALSNVTVKDAPALDFHSEDSFTLSAWVQPGGLRHAEEGVITKSREQGNYYGIWINANNQWVFRGPLGDVVGPTATTNWTHVAAVQDGVARKRYLYVNGVLVGSGETQGADGEGDLWIGQANGIEQPFPGNIDEVRLYNRALSATEITSLLGPPILHAVSRQTQGAAGPLDLILPTDSSFVVESRSGSVQGNYQLVLTFSSPVTGIRAELGSQPGQPGTPIGSVGPITYDSTKSIVTLNLTGIASGQKLDVNLSKIQLTTATINGTAVIPFNVLWGDVNGDGFVNGEDVQTIQSYLDDQLTPVNFLADINCTGRITIVDAQFAKTPPQAQLNSGALPAPWLDCDIGAVDQPGTATESTGVFTITGTGFDIGALADQFHYVYQPVAGNCTIIARVTSMAQADSWSKAGIMIRETLASASRNAKVVVTPSSGVAFQTRAATGGSTSNVQLTGVKAPYWIELKRTGNVFTAFSSPDGVTWTALGAPQTIPMASSAYVGLAVTSHNTNLSCTATIDKVSLK